MAVMQEFVGIFLLHAKMLHIPHLGDAKSRLVRSTCSREYIVPVHPSMPAKRKPAFSPGLHRM